MKDLQSSVSDMGGVITQIIHFSDGSKKTFEGIKTASISQSEFTRMDLIDGRRIYVNQKNVNCFEVHTGDKSKNKVVAYDMD